MLFGTLFLRGGCKEDFLQLAYGAVVQIVGCLERDPGLGGIFRKSLLVEVDGLHQFALRRTSKLVDGILYPDAILDLVKVIIVVRIKGDFECGTAVQVTRRFEGNPKGFVIEHIRRTGVLGKNAILENDRCPCLEGDIVRKRFRENDGAGIVGKIGCLGLGDGRIAEHTQNMIRAASQQSLHGVPGGAVALFEQGDARMFGDRNRSDLLDVQTERDPCRLTACRGKAIKPTRGDVCFADTRDVARQLVGLTCGELIRGDKITRPFKKRLARGKCNCQFHRSKSK